MRWHLLISVGIDIVVADVGGDARRIAVVEAEQESAAFAQAAAATAQVEITLAQSQTGILIA